MSALREMFVRQQIVSVLENCDGLLLLEQTLMTQVNLTLTPAAAPKEISRGLDQLLKKGRIEFEVDEEDARLKKWRISKTASHGHD